MKKASPKINPDLKIREYIDDAKMTAAQIVHDIEALNQIKSVIASALEDVEQQIDYANTAFDDAKFFSHISVSEDDPLPVDTQIMNYQIDDDQVIDETDQ